MTAVGNITFATLTAVCLAASGPSNAVTTVFFDGAQTFAKTSGITSDTITTEGYRFTYTLDKLFTGGTGSIIGRQELVQWPTGLHAQAVTTPGPAGSAQITISRVDGIVFDLNALTFKLFANTWATGADLEITPMRDGNDGPQVFLDATGVGGFSTFTYSTTLSDYDTYNLSLFVDYGLLAITLTDASLPAVPEPRIWAIMLAGLGCVGWQLRRSARRARAACLA